MIKFSWDPEKAKINKRKHGVSFEQACSVFSDPLALTIYDKEHSEKEDRWILLGQSNNDVLILLVHTFSDEKDIERVRIISARKASKREKSAYQKRSQP